MAEPSVFMLAAWTNDPAGWAAVETGLRLVTAAVLGGLIGLERGVHGRSAGLRTQMLVAVGAALAMVVNLRFADVFVNPDTPISIDPSRVAYGVMGGVGFLGAGAIIRFGESVRGLTTAASIWFTAGMGVMVVFGFIGAAIAATAIALATLMGLVVAEDYLPPRSHFLARIEARGVPPEDLEAACRRLLADRRVAVRELEMEIKPLGNEVRLVFRLQVSGHGARADIVPRLSALPGVTRVGWMRTA